MEWSFMEVLSRFAAIKRDQVCVKSFVLRWPRGMFVGSIGNLITKHEELSILNYLIVNLKYYSYGTLLYYHLNIPKY